MTSFSANSTRITATLLRRRTWLSIHRWLGLIAGGFLVVIGLTGSALVYWRNIDAWLNPQVLVVASKLGGPSAYRPMADLVAAARAAVPPGFSVDFVQFPQHDHETVRFYANGRAEDEEGRSTTNVFVNPYTAQVTGTRLYRAWGVAFRGSLVGFLFNLHSTLLLGPIGIALVGGLSVLLIVSILTGLIVWWPITGEWSGSFILRKSPGPKRFVFDLHKLAGVYTSLVLLAVLVSGLNYNLPSQFRWIVEQFSPLTSATSLKISAQPGTLIVPVDEVLAKVRRTFPDGDLYSVSLPTVGKTASPYSVTQLVTRTCCFVARRNIQLDPYSGEVLRVGEPFQGNGGDVLIQWQPSIHAGVALGEVGRILVLLAGIGASFLFVTGIVLWLKGRASPVT